MNNTEKASEIAGLCHHCLDKDGNPFSICTKCKVKEIYYACIKMAKWKDEQYKAIKDFVIDFVNNSQCDEMSEEIMNAEDEWCEHNCTSEGFNEKCLMRWLEVKSKTNGEKKEN